MKIINEAMVQVNDIIKDLPMGCSNNLDACQCIETCTTIKNCA